MCVSVCISTIVVSNKCWCTTDYKEVMVTQCMLYLSTLGHFSFLPLFLVRLLTKRDFQGLRSYSMLYLFSLLVGGGGSVVGTDTSGGGLLEVVVV